MTKIALFPCKLDPPHVGHVLTLIKISNDYEKIIVDIYENDNKLLDLQERIDIISPILDLLDCEISYNIHETSYSKDISNHPVCDTVVSGNKKILSNFSKHGVPTRKIDESLFYRSSIIKKAYKNLDKD